MSGNDDQDVVSKLHELRQKNSMEEGMKSAANMALLLAEFKKQCIASGFTDREAMELVKEYFNGVLGAQLNKPKG